MLAAAEDIVKKSSRASVNSVVLVENNVEPYELTILLLGDCKTGKTSLITSLLRFSQEENAPGAPYLWNPHYEPTLLEDEFVMQCMVDGYPIKLKLIDTAGHSETKQMEHFEFQSSRKSLRNSMQQNWWQEADGYVMVFDATNRTTFESLEQYYKMVLLLVNNNLHSDKSFCLVATKLDANSKRQVSTEEIQKFASTFYSLDGNLEDDNSTPIPFFEVSIKEQPDKVQFIWNQIILYTLRQQMLKKMFLEETGNNKKRTSLTNRKSLNTGQNTSPRGDMAKHSSKNISSNAHKLFAHKSRGSQSESDAPTVSVEPATSDNQIKSAIDELLEAQREAKAKQEAEELKKKKKFKLFSFLKKPKVENK